MKECFFKDTLNTFVLTVKLLSSIPQNPHKKQTQQQNLHNNDWKLSWINHLSLASHTGDYI